MIFRSLLSKVVEGLSNLSPVKNFIKYMLDRTLNEMLTHQIKLEDFKNGELLLTNIEFNIDKINREFMLSSPYIMHQGRVGNLKITLPVLSQLSTKSIELSASKVQIDLKPNKQFYQNFKEAMKQQQAPDIQQPEDGGVISQNSPLDFFKQLIKQIVLNIKIKTENVVVRLFINEPSVQKQKGKPQYYLMLRCPKIIVGKNEDISNNEDIEQIKFNLEVPQLSLHLLKEGANYPQYAQQNYSKQDYPFIYPPVYHPSTILLVGSADLKESKESKLIYSKFILNLVTNYKDKKKEILLNATIANIQTIIDPIQIKIISRFIAQIQQFKKILKYAMKQLGIKSQAEVDNLLISRRDSKNKSGNFDLFASMMMSINNQGFRTNKKSINQNDLFKSIIEEGKLKSDAKQFNQSVLVELRKSGNSFSKEIAEGYRNIKFKNEFRLKFEMGYFEINILKYVTVIYHPKLWNLNQREHSKVNNKLGCSHFMARMKRLSYSFSSTANRSQVNVGNIKIYNVKLWGEENYMQSVSQEFYDAESDSSTFYNTNINQNYFVEKPELKQFKLNKNQHFCLEELFRISPTPSKIYQTQNIKRYAFIPTDVGLKQELSTNIGFTMLFNGDSKQLKFDIKEVSVMINTEIAKDILNIAYPIFLYQQLVERTNIKAVQIPHKDVYAEQKIKNNNIFFQSQYNFKSDAKDSKKIYQQIQSKQFKISIGIKVQLIYCNYRQSLFVKQSENLIGEVERKVIDGDNFSKQCFCNLKKECIYGEIELLQFQKTSKYMTLGIKDMKAGLMKIQNSTVKECPKPILSAIDRFFVIQDKESSREKDSKLPIQKETLRVIVPKVRLELDLVALLNFMEIIKRLILIIQNLKSFNRCLSAKMVNIDKELFNIVRTNKKNIRKVKVIQVFVGDIELIMLFTSLYMSRVYFVKNDQEMVLKVKALVIALNDKITTRLSSIKNRVLTVTDYPITSKYPNIFDTNIILLIDNKKFTSLKPFNLVKRDDYFKEIQKSSSSIMIFIKKSVQIQQQDSKFRFNNNIKRMNNKESVVICEQKKCKNVDILLAEEIRIFLANAIFLRKFENDILELNKKIQEMKKQIDEQSKNYSVSERKDSEITDFEGQQININIKSTRFSIDITPEFIVNNDLKERTYSNTRMIVVLNFNKIAFKLNSDIGDYTLESNFGIETLFLKHDDRQPSLNPILLEIESAEDYGFKKILQINDCEMKSQIRARNKRMQFGLVINEIFFHCCLSSLPLIKLFFQHLNNHNIDRNYGVDREQFFQVIADGDEKEMKIQQIEEPEDVTGKFQEYDKKLEKKNEQAEKFKIKDFSAQKSKIKGQNYEISINSIIVNKVKIKLHSGYDFKFLNCDTFYESKSEKRCRSQTEGTNTFYLTIQKVKIQIELASNKDMQILLECDKIQLVYSCKKIDSGFLGISRLMNKQTEQQLTFSLLKNDSLLKVLIVLNNESKMFKLNKIDIALGFTEDLLKLVDQYKVADYQLKNSGWIKQYPKIRNKKQIKIQKQKQIDKMFFALLPEGRITATIEYLGKRIISQRVIKTQQLQIHEEETNEAQIMHIFQAWTRRILFDNLGTLISGAGFELFSGFIELIISFIRTILSIPFPKLRK